MLLNGQQFLESLRDGRRVYVGSEEINDVTTHPAFRNTAASFARLYEAKQSAENVDVMAYEDEDGEKCTSWYLMPKTKDDLRKRTETHRRFAEMSCGLLGRSPDHVASFAVGLAMRPDIFDDHRAGFGQHLQDYVKHMAKNDIFACYTVLPPNGARKPELYQREGMKVPTLAVTAEDDAGVTLNGMKMIGTSGVFCHDIWVGNLLPLAPDQGKESITCAVPANAPGVKIWSRKPFERYAVSEFDNPLSYKFDETDTMVIFEDVKVPWERVFTHDDAMLSREIYFQSPSHVMGNHQSNVRFQEKFRFILGIARYVTEMNNVGHIPAVQGVLGKLAAWEGIIEGLIMGQIEGAEEFADGYLTPNRRSMYACLNWCTQNYHLVCEEVRELLGAGPFQMPADISVIQDEQMREQFETYWSVPGQDAIQRMKFIKLAWDMLGSDFAGRHVQYEKFYGGPAFVNTHYNYLMCPWDEFQGIVEGVMSDYDVPAASQSAAAE